MIFQESCPAYTNDNPNNTMTTQKILNTGNNKTSKGEKLGWKTYGIHLAPSKVSGYNVCKWASKGCAMACLNTAGRGMMDVVQQARIKKTRRFFEDKQGFLAQLVDEITKAVRSAERGGYKPCFRLNLTSDIPWERVKIDGENIFQIFTGVQFYDYTKSTERMDAYLAGSLPVNYHLTLSRSEDSDDQQLMTVMDYGGNTAIVFRGMIPETWNGYPVIDADENDLRFLDPQGVVCGLVEKGLAKKDLSGFVLEPQSCAA
jgi:hypothetical protein